MGLPLHEVFLRPDATNDEYEAAMAAALSPHRDRGVTCVAFGDLFLQDIRDNRDALMARNGMQTAYPVWGQDTCAFIEEFIAAGFKAIVICVDLARIDETFAGRVIDAAFLQALPPGVPINDPETCDGRSTAHRREAPPAEHACRSP